MKKTFDVDELAQLVNSVELALLLGWSNANSSKYEPRRFVTKHEDLISTRSKVLSIMITLIVLLFLSFIHIVSTTDTDGAINPMYLLVLAIVCSIATTLLYIYMKFVFINEDIQELQEEISAFMEDVKSFRQGRITCVDRNEIIKRISQQAIKIRDILDSNAGNGLFTNIPHSTILSISKESQVYMELLLRAEKFGVIITDDIVLSGIENVIRKAREFLK